MADLLNPLDKPVSTTPPKVEVALTEMQERALGGIPVYIGSKNQKIPALVSLEDRLVMPEIE